LTQTTADLERAIDRERVDLAHNVSELTACARAAVDWREPVRRHPALACGAAFASAFALAQWVGRATRPVVRTAVEAPAVVDPIRRPARRPGPLGPIGAAVIATATTVFVGALEDAVMGWVDRRRGPRREGAAKT
jgi:hypothetical protein